MLFSQLDVVFGWREMRLDSFLAICVTDITRVYVVMR